MDLAKARPNDVLDGRYRLIERIGQGGFGDVWRAVELLPDGAAFRDVALKLLSPELAGAAWADEAKLLASFSHPSLVTIFAAGILEKSHTPFVAMELLQGETLADQLKRQKKIPWRAALHYARDVAAALDVIHLRGVVHLDLKPANLFVTEAGAVKVLDFGISRRQGARARVISGAGRDDLDASLPTALFIGDSDPYAATQAADSDGRRAVAGTPGFVAPEVLEMSDPTCAADAYALGATIVQLVTGKLPHAVSEEPHDWTNPETVRSWWLELREATLRGRFRDLAEDGVPKGLAALTKRLLSVDPVARACPPGSLAAQLGEVWLRPYGVHHDPYPGLAPFDPTREGTLPGRDGDIARMARDLTFEATLVVLGERGAGKTSLVLAGIVPALAKARVDGKQDWRAIILDPRIESHRSEADVAETIAPGSATLDAAIATLGEIGIAIVVDPLEALVDVEVSSETRSPAERESVLARPTSSVQGFALLLGTLLGASKREGLRVIGCLDEEMTQSIVDRLPPEVPLRSFLRYLSAPSTADAGDVALGPARLAGAVVKDPDLVVRAVEDELKREHPALPFVGAALAKWWSDRGGKPELSGARFLALGGVKGAVLDEAEAAFKDLTPADQGLLTETLLALTATDGALLERSVTEVNEVVGDDVGAVRAIDHLVDRHLVLRRGAILRVASEALASWPRLESARLAAMDRLAFRERLREAAVAWERSGQRKEYVDGGALLADLALHKPHVARLSQVETDFVNASMRSRKRRRIVFSVGALFAVLCVAALLFGRRALEERRRTAEASARAAEHDAYVSGIIARARRSPDPYVKVAFVVEAMRARASEPSLGVELFDAAEHLAPARVLTLDNVKDIEFPWDDRWLVGQGRAGSLVLIDLKPTKVEPDVVEQADLDFDPATAPALARRPKVIEVMVHDEPMVEVAAFRFDTALVTRSASGEVRVVRLLEDGSVVLAAVPPLRCAGKLVLADRAPVVACTTRGGLATWDMRDGKLREEPFAASALALSPDGADVVAWAGNHALFWRPRDAEKKSFELARTVMLASWSPRERAAAFVGTGGYEVVALGTGAALEPRSVAAGASFDEPIGLRWDKGGLDVVVCNLYGSARWHYLRRGGRAKTDPPVPIGTCDEHTEGAPEPIRDRDGFGSLANRSMGTHLSKGGFRLPRDRYLSRSLLMMSAKDDAIDRLVSFVERTESGEAKPADPHDSIVSMVRVGDLVAVEGSSGVTILGAVDGVRRQSAEGHLLGACPKGRILAWRRKGEEYDVFDVREAAHIASVPRMPGILVGTSPSCTRLYTEDLDGTLRSYAIDGGDTRSSKVVAKLDGYVFDAKPSIGGGPVHAAPGLLLAVSSGAVLRIDEVTDELRVLSYATPYATAIADGPGELETSYADATGVTIVRATGAVERIVEGSGTTLWQDIAPTQDRGALVLAAADRISVLDIGRREIVLHSQHDGLTRFARWDDEGSLLAFSPDLEGKTSAVILPFGEALATNLGAVASNLRVKDGRLLLKN